MKKIILSLVMLFAFVNASATHLLGGEITWQCLKSGVNQGKYVFTMKLYRDCTGAGQLPTFPQDLDMWGAGAPLTTIILNFDTAIDISPSCDVLNSGYPALDCYSTPSTAGAVEEAVYTSLPIALPGLPPTAGWHFTWSSCCRPASVINLANPSGNGEGYTLRASMYPYFVNGIQVPVGPCFDSSPVFNESPNTIICTGYPFAYSHNASDSELDSITYQWAEPLDDFFGTYNPGVLPLAIPFVPPYSVTSPIPSIVPGGVQLDPITGEISYHSNTAGSFATTISVRAYKCGQLVSEIFRDIPVVLINCLGLAGGAQNNPPVVTAPTGSQTWNQTIGTSGLPSYSTTINAGELVTFDINANDSDLYAGGIPQELTMTISGGQVTPCDNPPCATFSDVSGNNVITAPSLVSGVFSWQTECIQVLSAAGCGNTTNIFTFLVKVVDDFCPANAIRIATIKITVLPALFQPAPLFQCVTESTSGNVLINWDNSTGHNSTVYYVYGADNISGPYALLTAVNYPSDYASLSLANLPPGTRYYYMTLESLCANTSASSDTLIPIMLDINSSNINCWDDTDGRIAINMITNVITPFTYSLNGDPNPNAYPLDSVWENLPAGTYDITISDNANCVIEEEISITAPGFPLQALVSGNMSFCYGDTLGLAVGFGSGGTPDYSYEWFDDTYTSFSLNDTAYGLSSGSYYLEVTDDNGCDTFTSVQVISPQTSLSGNPQIFGVVCKGDSTGMLVGDAQGSFAPYQYYWLSSVGDTLQDSGVRLTRDTLFGLVSGSYNLHVYDAKGCFVSYSMNVGEPATKLSIDSMVVIESIACYGDSVGKARFYSSGGVPNYAYLWDNGEVGIIADELTSGYHSVMLSDDWGCEIEDSIYVPENSEIESQISTIQNASCYGYDDGIAWVASLGGVPAYTYFWSNGQAPGFMPDTAIGLLHGSYYVTTQDILGCEVVDSIYISEPDPLSMEASELDWIDCYGDSTGLAYATAVGGTAPYTFIWDNGQWVGDTINTLTAELHTVVVTDTKGCSATDTVFTHEPIELEIKIDSTQTVLAYCIGVNTASLTAIASGGTPGYTYHWNDNGFNPQTTATASSLLAGVYTITVTDTKGCIASDTRDIDTLTSTMDATVTSLIQYVGGNDVSCFGENDAEAMVTAWGAHAPYVYQWYGTNGFNSNNDSITNLYAGTYSVTVRDTNNCMVNSSIVIAEPDYLYFTTLGFTDESCLGACNGEIQIDIIGGEEPYTGISTENTTGNTITSLMANDSIVPGICSGSYTIIVTDANDCPSSVINGGIDQQVLGASFFTTANIDPAAITNILCNGTATGSLQVLNPDTTNSNYSYSWQNEVDSGVSISTTTQATSLIAGTYVLYAHYADGNNLNQNYAGCTTTDTVSILELSILESVVTITDVDCYGATTGKLVSGQVSGGTSLYDLQWNPGGVMGSVMNNLTAGIYTLTITDANGCQEVDTFEVTEPQALTANITQNGYVLTAGTPVGGTAPFSYSWRRANTSVGTGIAYTVTNYGVYYVRVKDSNGCIAESNSFEYIETGVGQVSSGVVLSIYPNPFKEETTVDFGRVVKQASVRVVDVFGKLIEEYRVANTDKHILKRENKASGIYFMEIEMEQKEKTIYKLIVE